MKKLILILLFVFVSTYAFSATDYCADSGMKAGWLMNESSGTAINDCSSNNNDGTLSVATSAGTGKYSYGVTFPYTNNNKMTVASASSINGIVSLSIGGWVAPNTAGADSAYGGKSMIFFRGNVWYLQISSNNNLCFKYSRDVQSGAWCTDTNSFTPDSLFKHVAVVYDNSSTSNDPVIYINGTSVNVTEISLPIGTASSDSGFDLLLGLDGVDLGEFDGVMDEMFVYSGALNSTQINEIKDSGLDGSQSAPAPAVYNTSINSSSVFYDSIIN